MSLKRLVILFSGEGSNMQNLVERLHGKTFDDKHIEVVAAITNNPNAGGIARARALGIPLEVVDHTKYESREAFDRALVARIETYRPDLTLLAGFMRILTPIFTEAVRALNIHPSLLPLFKGAHAIERSFASDMKVGGVTVHWVEASLDGGAIVAQGCFERDAQMDLASFEAKIHALEYRLYPEAVLQVI